MIRGKVLVQLLFSIVHVVCVIYDFVAVEYCFQNQFFILLCKVMVTMSCKLCSIIFSCAWVFYNLACIQDWLLSG